VRLDEAGLHVRQSEINTWLTCADSLRRELLARVGPEPAPAFESDAALAGTVLHGVIEAELRDGIPLTLPELQAHAAYEYVKAANGFREDANCTFAENQFKDDTAAIKTLDRLCLAWFQCPRRIELLYQTDHTLLRLEQDFDVHLFDHPDGIPIWLTGQIDCISPTGIDDWKSANQDYVQWERQRWAVQPTVYTYGAFVNGWVGMNQANQVPFQYLVFPKKGADIRPELIPVWRSSEHWDWLAVQLIPMVRQVIDGIERGFEREWVLNDQHALCSPKWCPWWKGCKGQIVRPDWSVTIRNRK
jgi:hypothetical protein